MSTLNKPFSFKVFPFVSTVSFLPHYIGPFSSYEATCSQFCFQKLFLNEINFFPFCNLKSCLLEALIHAPLSHCTLSPWMLMSTSVVSISPCICLDLFLGCTHPAWNLLQIPHLANLQSTFSLQASQRHLQCHLSQTQVIIFPDSPSPQNVSQLLTLGCFSQISTDVIWSKTKSVPYPKLHMPRTTLLVCRLFRGSVGLAKNFVRVFSCEVKPEQTFWPIQYFCLSKNHYSLAVRRQVTMIDVKWRGEEWKLLASALPPTGHKAWPQHLALFGICGRCHIPASNVTILQTLWGQGLYLKHHCPSPRGSSQITWPRGCPVADMGCRQPRPVLTLTVIFPWYCGMMEKSAHSCWHQFSACFPETFRPFQIALEYSFMEKKKQQQHWKLGKDKDI